MNKKMTLVVVIAAVIALCSGAAALSRVGAQQPVGTTPPEEAHGHVDEDHGKADPHEHEQEAAGHRKADDDQDGQADSGKHDDHEDDDGDDRGAGHDDHATEPLVRLSSDERDRFGVSVAAARSGKLTTQIRLPGEIVLNADRVAHIVPRAPGVVREVLVSVGDAVRAGEVMAWLESAELGEAKVDYLAKWAELGCCTVDLTRAQAVHDNTLELLEVLKSSPSLETLRDMNGNEMGENRSMLVSAYAELTFAQAAYLRERPLFEKKIASERDYQAAEAAYKKADALYAATRDSINFEVRRALLEAKRVRQVREIELKGARRRLFVLGLTSEEISGLRSFAQPQASTTAQKAPCTDPNCKDCKRNVVAVGAPSESDAHEAEEKLAWYPLRAPFGARVIERHLTLGEKHGDESSAFTIADLSSVWVNIAVYQKDLPYVREGTAVTVSAGAERPYAQGTIAYVAPMVNEKTRTAMARVVLPNPHGELRPGLFVNAELSIGQDIASVVVPKSAIQRMGEASVVFLETVEGFQPAVVSLGRASESHVEVLSGLAARQRYVTEGAFELKAKIITSGLGAHAGHGH